VLYVEDSRTVALATRRMLESQQLRVTHVISAEEALDYLRAHRDTDDAPGADLVLTDVYLKGELSGRDLVQSIRGEFGYGKRRLPVLVMTGDFNRVNQMALLRDGANDLVLKPSEERLLVTKALFQLRLSRMPEQREMQ
jgi:CheY-like chemotaxis protein